MAKRSGQGADVYICTGAGTAMTGEACALVSGTTYQVTNTARRYLDPTATWIVYDGASPLAAGAYELVYASGKIILASAPSGAVTITGKYLTASQFGQADKWTLNLNGRRVSSQVFGDAWETHEYMGGGGTVTLERFYNDAYFHANVGQLYLLVLYVNYSAGQRYMALGHMNGDSINTERGALIRESVSFDLHSRPDYSAT